MSFARSKSCSKGVARLQIIPSWQARDFDGPSMSMVTSKPSVGLMQDKFVAGSLMRCGTGSAISMLTRLLATPVLVAAASETGQSEQNDCQIDYRSQLVYRSSSHELALASVLPSATIIQQHSQQRCHGYELPIRHSNDLHPARMGNVAARKCSFPSCMRSGKSIVASCSAPVCATHSAFACARSAEPWNVDRTFQSIPSKSGARVHLILLASAVQARRSALLQ